MRNNYLRVGFFVFLLFSFLYLGISQRSSVSYPILLQQYADAQKYYDQATALSEAVEYGSREEALEKQWNEKALEGFTELYKKLPPSLYDSLRFHTSFKVGELQHYFENFSDAVFFYRQAILIKEKKSLPDSFFFKPYLYAGIIFYNQNKFDTAVQYFKQAEKIQAAYNNKLTEGERLYNILGVLYYDRGDYKQAQNYFQKALALLPRSHPYYNELFVNYNINLAQLHLRLEEYDKADEIYKQLLPKKINLNEINHNIGSLNLSLGAAAKAIQFFRKVSYENNKVIRLYNSLGEAFFNLQRFDSAIHYYRKASHAFQSLGTNTDPVGYGLVLKNLGQYEAHFKNYPDALEYFQQAIHRFYPAFSGKDVRENPQQFSGVFSFINLFNTLNAKAEAWHQIYLSGKDLSAAKEELKAYQSAFKLIEYVEQTYDSDEARLFLTRIKHAVHDKPIDIAFDLYNKTKDKEYLETLYYFDQQNKAAILSLNRQLNRDVLATGSPQQKKEQEIKSEITRLSIRAAQVTDSAQLVVLNNTIRDQEIALGKLRQDILPQSFQKANIPAIADLQSSFDKKTALISYHLSDEKMTSLIITKNDVTCHQQNLPVGFIEKMQAHILALKTPSSSTTNDTVTNYYDLLLSPLPIENMEQLIIIPDDVLAYFPFETLRTAQGRYLIEDIAVLYQFSTALLGKNESNLSGAETISFAPFANQSYGDSLPQLQSSAKEIASSTGQQFLDTAATKGRFIQYAGHYQIMHLATHAEANNNEENFSYIAFSPAKGQEHLLYAQEIYNLRLQNTGLVILSACETGAGLLVKGEGVLSLSRAFSYAGCPNIITSLWKADDFSTANITARIHQYLEEGYAISNAVQQSKIDYLRDKTINPRLKQPYYWSHLVFIGNYNAEQKFQWTWFIVAAILALTLIVLLIKKPGFARHSGLRRMKSL